MRTRFGLAAAAVVLSLSSAWAGMPEPLPVETLRTFRIADLTLARLQTISFFLVGFFLCAGGVQWLWNLLRRDFPSLPRMTYTRAVGGVTLWGLLAVVVLTMISGARELMTPGAWRKQGSTYKLADEPTKSDAVDPEAARRRRIEQLRTALWQFAATHSGKFPTDAERTAISSESWEVPGAGGLHYFYVSGRTAGHVPEVLAYEPELDPNRRFVLYANGDILTRKSDEIHALLMPPMPKATEGTP